MSTRVQIVPRSLVLGIVVALLGVGLAGISGIGSAQSSCPSGTDPHEPIDIDGDSDFTSLNGVRSGTGTAADPYVISDWCIRDADHESDLNRGIDITGTSAHVVVKDNYVSGWGNTQVWINSNQNVDVQNNLLEFGDGGAARGMLVGGQHQNVTGNEISGAFDRGFRVHKASHSLVANNTITDPRMGLQLKQLGSGTVIQNNTMSGTDLGLHVDLPIAESAVVASSNTVPGGPVRLVSHQSDVVVDSTWEPGFLMFRNVTNATVRDVDTGSWGGGADAFRGAYASTNVTVENVTERGPRLVQFRASEQVKIWGSNLTSAVKISFSENVTFRDSRLGGDGNSLRFDDTNNTTVRGSTLEGGVTTDTDLFSDKAEIDSTGFAFVNSVAGGEIKFRGNHSEIRNSTVERVVLGCGPHDFVNNTAKRAVVFSATLGNPDSGFDDTCGPAVVADNTVTDGGVRLRGTDPAMVRNNTLDNAGMLVFGPKDFPWVKIPGPDNVTIENNVIEKLITFKDRNAKLDAKNITVRNNTIRSHGFGVLFKRSTPRAEVDIVGNHFVTAEAAIKLDDYHRDPGEVNVVAHRNTFDAHDAIVNQWGSDPAYIMNATNNHWGAPTGPGSTNATDPYHDPLTGWVADGAGGNVTGNDTSGEANVRFAPTGNPAPSIDPVSDQTAIFGDTLLVNVSVTEPEGEPFGLFSGPLPSGATFTSHGDGTGTFNWTPGWAQQGTHEVTFHAQDQHAIESQEGMQVTVENVPVNLSAPDLVEAPEETTVSVSLEADNLDGPQPIDWSFDASRDLADTSLSENNTTATWSWEVPRGAANVTVTWTANDGLDTDSATTKLAVVTAPLIDAAKPLELSTGTRSTTLIVDETVQLEADVTDSDGQVTNVTVFPRGPNNASITPDQPPSGTYVANVTYTEVATHDVVWQASDNDNNTVTFTQSVEVVENTPPTVDAGEDVTTNATAQGTAGKARVTLSADATDPEGRPLSYTWTFPTSATGDGTTDTVTEASPSYEFPVGVHDVDLTVTDANGASSSDSVTVVVDDALQLSSHVRNKEIPPHVQAQVTLVLHWHDGSVPDAPLWLNVTHGFTGVQTVSMTVDVPADGGTIVDVPYDVHAPPAPGVGVNLLGQHEVTLEAHADSRAGAPIQDIERVSARHTFAVETVGTG